MRFHFPLPFPAKLIVALPAAALALFGFAPGVLAAPAATTTALAITAAGSAVTTVSAGAVITLTATVLAGSTPIIQGQVDFCDATAVHCEDIHIVGQAQLTASGTAVFKLRPAAGSHSYKAVFVGTTSKGASSSTAVALTVTARSSYPSVTSIASAGAIGSYTLTATVTGNGPGAPTGTVSFLDSNHGDAVVKTAPLTPGTAAFNFATSQSIAAGPDGVANTGAIADLNGDGIPDLVTMAGGGALVLLGNGDGTFRQSAVLSSDGLYDTNLVSVNIADFNGDGIPDVGLTFSAYTDIGDINGFVEVFLGNGDGTFSLTAPEAFDPRENPATGIAPYASVVGDFNQDGIADIATPNLDGTLTVLLGNGDGTFQAITGSTALYSGNPETIDADTFEPGSITIGDFNGDGIADLAVVNEAASMVYLLLGNGDGTFSTGASPAGVSTSTGIVSADFNGDGIADLAVGGLGGVLLGNGDGTFTLKPSSSALDLSAIAVTDFNGDGIPDLISANEVYLGAGDGTFTAATTSGLAGGILAVADFNGDGLPDIAEATSSAVTLQLTSRQSATATATGVAVAPPASGEHTVVASYPGDGSYSESTSGSAVLYAAQGTPTLSLKCSATAAVLYGTQVTFTLTVTGSGLTPTGNVQFYDGSTLLFSTSLSSGVASYATTALAPGTHSVTAQYAGDTNYLAAISSPAGVTVTPGAPVVVEVAASAASAVYGAQVTFTASVSGTAAYPTGTVNFLDGSTNIGAGKLNTSGVATFATGTLGVGTHSISASYAGDSNYVAGSSSPITVTINLDTPTLTVASSSGEVVVGTSVTFTATATGSAGTPSGQVIFLNGPDQIGSGTLSAGGTATMTTSALPVGFNPITVNYAGSAIYEAATSAPVYVSVTTPVSSSVTTLAIQSGGAAATSVAAGTVVTLTASVITGSTPATQGIVNFCDASAPHCEDVHLVGTAQLTSAGTASLKFRPGIGTHMYKAEFAGSKNYTASAGPSVSAAVTITVTYSGSYPSNSTLVVTGSLGDYTLSAEVGGAGPQAPTGTVSFLDASNNNSVLGTATLGADMGPAFHYVTGPDAGSSLVNVVAGDFNGDGRMDLAVTNEGNPSSTLTVLLANPGGTFTASSPIDIGVPAAMAVSDFNGDGKMDIAVLIEAATGISVTTLLGNGDGTFKTSSTALPAVSSPENYGAEGPLVVGDFNGDGIPDLALVMYVDQIVPAMSYLEVLLGKGDGTFTALAPNPNLGSGAESLQMADFNGDGVPDLLVLNSAGLSNPGSATVWLGNGDGSFTAVNTSAPVAASPYIGYSAVTADFNGDGIPDLAVSSADESCIVQVFLGNGDATFAPPQSYQTVCDPEHLYAADFSGSGTPDLAAVTGNRIQMLIGKGDGTFTSGITTPAVAGPAGATADFNGDGVPDLALTAGTDTAAQIWIMKADPHIATGSVSGFAVEPAGSGTHREDVSYPGDSTYSASTSQTVTLTSAMGTPTVSVAASPNPAADGASVTLTATVAGAGAIPTGTVAFYDGNTILSSATLNSSGVATYSSTAFSVGAHSITATYSGDTDYNVADSTAYTLNINPATGLATVTVKPGSGSVTSLQPLPVTVTVSAGAGNPAPTGTVTLSSGTYMSTAATLSGGSATIIIPAGKLNTGSDTLTAMYSGSAQYSTASGTAMVTVTETTPAVTVTPSPATITTLQGATVTVGVGGGAGAPEVTGSVVLTSGTYSSPAASLVSGSASIAVPAGALAAGVDTLTATFTPDSAGAVNYLSAAGVGSVTVNKAAVTVTVTPPAGAVTTVQAFTVAVAVSGGAGAPPATGKVILSSGSFTSSAVTLAAGAATISVPAGSVAAGTATLMATYTPDIPSSATYDGGFGMAAITVNKAASITSSNASPSSITTAQPVNVNTAVSGGAGNPAPTGEITLSGGGYTSTVTTLSGGSAIIAVPAGKLPIGADTLTVAYTGDAVYLASSGTVTVTVSPAIGSAASTVTVTPASLFITNQQTDAVAIAVTGSSGQPTGTVTLASGAYSAQASLASGAASITIPAGALPAGPNIVTATYSGDPTYAAATGTAIVTVSELVSIAPGSTSVAPGGNATPSITISAGSAYSGTLDLTCKLTSSPSGAVSLPTCSLNPATLTLSSGGSGKTVVTVSTTAGSSASLVRQSRNSLWGMGGGAVLAALFLCGVPARRRRFASMLTLAWMAVVALAIGCGGGGSTMVNKQPPVPATTAGSYAFAVTGTDSSNAAVTTTATVAVTVQ